MMISAMMLIAISSGVSAFNSSPVGARTSFEQVVAHAHLAQRVGGGQPSALAADCADVGHRRLQKQRQCVATNDLREIFSTSPKHLALFEGLDVEGSA
jgi:hypothetical protein